MKKLKEINDKELLINTNIVAKNLNMDTEEVKVVLYIVFEINFLKYNQRFLLLF